MDGTVGEGAGTTLPPGFRGQVSITPSVCRILPGQWSRVQWRRGRVSSSIQGSDPGIQQRFSGEAGGGECWVAMVDGVRPAWDGGD